jgi:hypothetical protein
MLQAVQFGSVPALTAAPAIGTRTLMMRTDTTLWGDNTLPPITFPHTSASGNVVYLGVARSSGTPTRTLVPDWNGASMLPELAGAKLDGALNYSCQAALEAGGFVGAGSFNVTGSAAVARFAYFLGWIMDLDQVRGGVGAGAANVIAVTQAFVEVSLAVTQPGSLLIAAGWCSSNNPRPFVWSLGWDKLDEQQIGTGGQPCGSLATKISTAAGAEMVRMTGDGATTGQWGIVAVEFLPG